jgi:hypothetical protein
MQDMQATLQTWDVRASMTSIVRNGLSGLVIVVDWGVMGSMVACRERDMDCEGKRMFELL